MWLSVKHGLNVMDPGQGRRETVMARCKPNFRKKANGWEYRYTFEGKRYSEYGHTQDECLAKSQERMRKIKAGLKADAAKLTLDMWFDEWIRMKRSSVKPASLNNYRVIYRKNISPLIGKQKLVKIEKKHILDMQDVWERSFSVAYANNLLRICKMIFEDAVKEEIIEKSPAANVRTLKKGTEKEARETIHRAFTVEEQAAFMDEMKKNYYYPVAAFMLLTGMRLGEVAALEWDDINLEEMTLRVSATSTVSEDGKRTTGKPKSKAGEREIPLKQKVLDLLDMAKERRELLNIPKDNQRVFFTPYGKEVSDGSINRAINSTLKSLEGKGVFIERITSHCFRDTFATRYIECGGNPNTLKEILGHSSLSMTMDLYAHVLPNTKRKEMDSIKIEV